MRMKHERGRSSTLVPALQVASYYPAPPVAGGKGVQLPEALLISSPSKKAAGSFSTAVARAVVSRISALLKVGRVRSASVVMRYCSFEDFDAVASASILSGLRSEERCVGKECG